MLPNGSRVRDVDPQQRGHHRPVGPTVEGRHHRVADTDLTVAEGAVLDRHPCEFLAVERGGNEVGQRTGVVGDHPRRSLVQPSEAEDPEDEEERYQHRPQNDDGDPEHGVFPEASVRTLLVRRGRGALSGRSLSRRNERLGHDLTRSSQRCPLRVRRSCARASVRSGSMLSRLATSIPAASLLRRNHAAPPPTGHHPSPRTAAGEALGTTWNTGARVPALRIHSAGKRRIE